MNQSLLSCTCALVLSIAFYPNLVSADKQFSSVQSMKTGANQATFSADQLFTQASESIKQRKMADGIALLKKAAERGHPKALFELASYYELGLGVSKDFSKAIQYYEEAIKAGFSDAQFNLALLLIKPDAALKNLKKARQLMTTLANQDDIEAQYSLSLMLKDESSSTSADFKQSLVWLQLAADAGHSKAQFNLGLHYLKGEQVAKNPSHAFLWFNKAAKKGMPRAQFNLALMYESGLGTSVNLKRSLQWYQSAAQLGNANAQQNLGIKYLLGQGLEIDESKAFILITKAAKQKNKSAQFLLARLYHKGSMHMKADKVEAEKWYLLAARQGYREAQYQLALLLSEKKDSQIAAKYWAYQATFAGHEKAYLLQAKL